MQSLDFLKRFGCKVLYNHSSISHFQSGGEIKTLIYPQSYFNALAIFEQLQQKGIPYLVVGRCTNILIKDSGYNGVMVCMNDVIGTILEDDGIYSYSGEKLSNIALIAKANLFSGLEELAHIPGSVGGAIAMNSGAFNKEIKDVLEYVDVVENGAQKRVRIEDFNMEYRSSICSKKLIAILGAKFKLQKEKLLSIDAKMKRYLDMRNASQPKGISLGSVFKKAGDVSAGYYIEKVGLKGIRKNGAMISNKHANFIMNVKKAKSSDFIDLAELARSEVDKAFHISLQYEVLLV